MQIVAVGFLHRIFLQQQSDPALRAHRFLGRREGALAADGDRQHDPRKQHDVAHGEHDEHVLGRGRIGHRGGVIVHRPDLVRRRCR